MSQSRRSSPRSRERASASARPGRKTADQRRSRGDHHHGVRAKMHTMTERAPHNIHEVLDAVNEYWSPRTIAVVNDYDARVVKVQGEFTRHRYPETDEFFLVLSGTLTIRMDDGDVVLSAGDAYVVPRGVHHQPCAESETTLLLFEPSDTVNTGDTLSELIVERRLA